MFCDTFSYSLELSCTIVLVLIESSHDLVMMLLDTRVTFSKRVSSRELLIQLSDSKELSFVNLKIRKFLLEPHLFMIWTSFCWPFLFGYVSFNFDFLCSRIYRILLRVFFLLALMFNTSRLS